MTSVEVEKSIREIWAMFKETDNRFKETDNRFKETDARLEKMFKETDQKIKKLSDLFDGQWGKLIEALAESGILEQLQARNIDVTGITRRLKQEKKGRQIELDFLLKNEVQVLVGEVKTTLKVQKVNNFLEKLKDFFIFYPEYRGYQLYGAVIGLDIEEEADKYAYRHGLFVFKIGGDGMLKLLNDIKFKPKNFGAETELAHP